PPGTAKSALVKDLCQRIGGDYFQWLLTRFTTPEELFGPVSLKALEQDQYKRVTTNKLPEANIAFLDEIWKASSSILNTLLTIINEREFHNNGSAQKVPLISLFGASNELPESEELNALYDRFLIKHVTKYLADDASFRAMIQPVNQKQITTTTIQELEQMQAGVRAVDVPEDVLSALTNLRSLLKKENIIASDRRYKQSLELVKASAYLNGRTTASIDDLVILQHVLWSQPSEQKVVQKTVINMVNPTISKAQEIMDIASEIYHAATDPEIMKDPARASTAGIEAHVKLKKLSDELAAMKGQPASAQKVNAARNKVNGYIQEILSKLLGINTPQTGQDETTKEE
ncbi:MAG: AAA family ATPase, partial [Candidatus Methanoperedenaceae archaeon]|nr:AAA family ATPase [Candidatus Methanoperedenaceae archaeon]